MMNKGRMEILEKVLRLLEEIDKDNLEVLSIIGHKEGETSEYKKIHPLGQVPALEADGEVMLESCAMCHWLTDFFDDRGLAPAISDPARKHYEQWMAFSQATLEPEPWLILLHSRLLPETQRVPKIIPWATERTRSRLIMLNDALLGKDYLLGEKFSTADIMVGSTLFWIPLMLKDFPDLLAYSQRLKQRDAYIRASAE